MKALRAATAEMIREIQESWYYKANFVSDLIREIIIFGMIIFLGGYSSMGAVYNVPRTETRPLVLLGYLFWSYSAFALSAMGNDISFEAARGILEYKFTSVAPPALLLAGKAIGGVVTSTGFILVMCALIFLLFRVSIDVTAGALAALLLTLVGMYGLGYVFAGFALYAKRVNRAVTVFQTLIFFISGMLYPLEAMPEILGWISRSLPVTQGMHIARLSMVGLPVPLELWFMLTFTSLVHLAVGLLVFSYFARLVRKNGLLGSH